MIINHNLSSLSAFSSLRRNGASMQKVMRSLTTGLRINSASDDAAGLAVSERLRAQLRGVDQAIQNTQDGISMLQTAEGGLEAVTSMLQRMRELSVQAANDVLTQQDRSMIQTEVDQLKKEIKRVTDTTKFNKKRLLNGEASILWSSDDEKLRARVNGELSDRDEYRQQRSIEGNYKFEISASPGKAQVQKSNILEYSQIPQIENEDDGTTETSDSTKVLFLIDISGSMGDDIQRVRDNIDSFIGNIKSQGVENIQIGVCTYNASSGADAQTFLNGTLWSGDLEDIHDVLEPVAPYNGDMNNYEAVTAAVGIYSSSFSKNTSASQKRYMVVITDVDHNKSGGTEESLLSSLNGGNGIEDDIQFSAICPRVDSSSEFYSAVYNTGGLMFNINQDWSGDLTTSFASKIATDTIGIENGGEISEFPPAKDTELSYISKFISDSGSFVLDTPQDITITQGANSSTITLYAGDTIEELTKKINDAIAGDLGQAKYTNDYTHFAEYVYASTKNSESVEGTMIIRSIIPGEEGEIHFSGSEEILNALGLNTIQESKESEYKVSVSDAHSGEYILRDAKVTGNVIQGAITESIDVEFDSMAGVIAEWDDKNKEYRLLSIGPRSSVLHLSDNATKIQTGANEGEDVVLKLGDVSAKTLGVDRIDLGTVETASRSITIIDNALDKVLTQRARNAAQQSALEQTMQTLMVAREKIMKSESTIRDADMAKTMMEYVKITTLNQADVAVMSQANQVPQSVLSIMR
ncbi:MAG: VWA domain-containing protein [Synergistaceae bacterium]|nr:VWA domain-containing protein [Synergistaceae bacterium]MBQ3694158.1 VWA domain-containing protein [Synergistaceae bacterium]